MTSDWRKMAALFSASVLLIFVLAGVAIGAFIAGQRSVETELTSSPTVSPNHEKAEPLPTKHEEVDTPAISGESKSPGLLTPSSAVPEATADQQPVEVKQTQVPQATTGSVQSGEPLDLNQADLELLLEVWDIVDSEFNGPIPDASSVLYGAINGSLDELDDNYTQLLPPDIARRMRQELEGSFEGIGAIVDLNEEGYLLIVRAYESQPADLAGLRSGDLITHVDGVPVKGKSLPEITSAVKGPRGTAVTLTVNRPQSNETFDLTVVRERIEIPIVESKMLEENVAYVRLAGFSSNAGEQLLAALEELLPQNPLGLILDLRDNPGGFRDESVDVADLFLGDGVVLIQRDQNGLERTFESDKGDLAEEIPMVVLVNQGSASASEIVAGAIRDFGRGVLIGETTFGKGSVQQSHTLSDGSELRVTVARWYTPDDKSIDHEGISPDIKVETPDSFGDEADTQLQRAIQYLSTGE